MQPLDEYALMEWLKEGALKAHKKMSDCYCKDDHSVGEFHKGEEQTFNKVIIHIQNGRKSQRPHVEGGDFIIHLHKLRISTLSIIEAAVFAAFWILLIGDGISEFETIEFFEPEFTYGLIMVSILTGMLIGGFIEKYSQFRNSEHTKEREKAKSEGFNVR